MKRIICLISLFLITNQIAIAENNITSEELLTRFKTHRNAVYQNLELTQKQKDSITKIDNKVYSQLEPELKEISLYINKLNKIAESGSCTIEQVDAVKAEFKTTENRISKIKHKQEKAINNILTPEQKITYEAAKEVQRAKIQQEIENYKKEQFKNE